jgi:hypothetical protein
MGEFQALSLKLRCAEKSDLLEMQAELIKLLKACQRIPLSWRRGLG